MVVTNLIIPNTVNAPDGSLLFYGFTDTSNSYTSVVFGNTAAGTDSFGFDDMVIGDLGQVVVPVPAAVWLFGSGLLGLVGMARRKKTA
ncbi:MAG: VPLPA-CTERM sorting domain-containing protein [Pseudomonadota bacterium]|nr:VPLPA-CTERM sorting domain-containing protein [Pseudomonadota bacterium]